MSNGHHAFMRPEKGGPVEKIPLNKWAHYRRKGYVYASESDWVEQERGRVVEENTAAIKAAKKKKKKKVSKKSN